MFKEKIYRYSNMKILELLTEASVSWGYVYTSGRVIVPDMKAVKWTSRSRDSVAAAPLSHQRPTIYIWTICKRHIVTSWVVCVSHMKWISQKGTEPWSGNGKNFKRPVGHWLLTFWPRNDARHIVTLWVVCVPHMKRISQKGTEPQSKHGKTFQRPVWPWPLSFWPGNGAQHLTITYPRRK